MEKLKLNFNKEKLKLNLPPAPALNFSALSNGDIQRIVAAVEMALQGDFDLLNQNIDTHTTDTDIHITSDERTLWNTVSKKANKSDIGDRSGLPNPDETIVDNISFVKSCIDANNEEMSNTFFDKMVNVYTQIDNIQSELEDLQTQMGDIATILADIKADQEALINGGEE